ncbi:MAG TPA: TetR/AcrR family transcriptional regulator [Geobacteraceae bacterium]
MKETREDPLPAGAVRERLLEKALELFTAKGYAATSVREIVEAAGVSKPVLYYWFGSKEGIYLELMNSLQDTFAALLVQLTAERGGVRERLTTVCCGIFDSFLEHLSVVRLIYAIYFGPPQGAPPFPHEELFNRMVEIIGDIVHDGIAGGELRPVAEADATWAVVACLNATMEEQLCHNPPRVGRDGLIRTLNLIIDGLSHGR